jgi:DNA primase large subunit
MKETAKRSKVPEVVRNVIEKTSKWKVDKLHSDNRAWHRRRKFVLGGSVFTSHNQRIALVRAIEVELTNNQLQYDSVGVVQLESYAYGRYWAVIVNTRF